MGGAGEVVIKGFELWSGHSVLWDEAEMGRIVVVKVGILLWDLCVVLRKAWVC